MNRRQALQSAVGLTALWVCGTLGSVGHCLQAAPPERPNLNHTADPRPNILPNWIYNHNVPYRLEYNRPRYYPGKALYHVISPTSQEAMSWKENLEAGRYNGHHCPPMFKGYYYLKPWEALNVGPRPDTRVPSTTAVQAPAAEINLQMPEPIPSSTNLVPLGN